MRFLTRSTRHLVSKRDQADLVGDSIALIGSIDPIQGVDHPRDVPKCILEGRFLLRASNERHGGDTTSSDEFRPPRIVKR